MAIKVIDKALNVLEHLSAQNGKPVGLSEIADALGMHPATTANILLALVERRYVEQVAPRKGYMLGPAAFRLTGRSAYRHDIVALVRPHLQKLAQDVDETVLLATLREGVRVVLCQVDGRRTVRVEPEYLFQENVYATATGRLLLAHLNRGELDRAITRLGSPAADWPEAASPSALARELAAIRESGWVCSKTPHDVVGIAFPIFAKDIVVAALGLFLPVFRYEGEHKKNIRALMKQTAADISCAWPTFENHPNERK